MHDMHSNQWIHLTYVIALRVWIRCLALDSWVWIPRFASLGWTLGLGFLCLDSWDWMPSLVFLALDSWNWKPGLGFLGLDYWVWILGIGFLGLDS